jgi:N-acetylglutamate synthase-like GNAT family acetyltransferase
MTTTLQALRRAKASERPAIEALQRAAYARNRALLGVEPLPLLADYGDILKTMETWVADGTGGVEGVLILEPHHDHLLIWSIATDPTAQLRGLGRRLLAAAEDRARTLGLKEMRLYTGTILTHLVGWYTRHGYATTHVEQLPDRSVTHMRKLLP